MQPGCMIMCTLSHTGACGWAQNYLSHFLLCASKSCDPVTIQNLRRTFALKGTKEEGHKRILLGASRSTVEHCHHQLEKIWHNSDTTKNWVSLRNWWNDEKNLVGEASKKHRSSMKRAAGIPGVMRRGLHTRDAIWQIRSTFAKRSGQILPSPDPPWV